MSEIVKKGSSRREFLKRTGRIATASSLAAAITSRIYAAQSNTIKVALVGCGGRGSGAASNALSVKNGPIKMLTKRPWIVLMLVMW